MLSTSHEPKRVILPSYVTVFSFTMHEKVSCSHAVRDKNRVVAAVLVEKGI